MSFVDLHRYMAFASAIVVILVGLEGLVRAGYNRAPGALAARASAMATLALVVTIAGGLGLLVRGARPREMLHLIYAVLVFAAIPLTNAFTAKASPRIRGLATVFGALIALVLIWRLFSTG